MSELVSAKREIEIIPWRHNVVLNHHRDVIKYLERIPKRSTIFLELSPNLLTLYEDFIDHGTTWDVADPGTNRAILELVATSILFGHKIIPIDPQVSRRGAFTLDYSGVGGIEKESMAEKKKRVAINRLREKVMVRNMIARKDVQKGYFVCGVAHTKQIAEDLNNSNVNARINLKIFENSAEMESRMNLYNQYAKAIKYNQFERVLQLEQRRDALDNAAQKIGFSFAVERAVQRIQQARMKIMTKRLERHKRKNPRIRAPKEYEQSLKEKRTREKQKAREIARTRRPK